MKVFNHERFGIYINPVDHPPPHCHVRFADESEVCVTLPLIEPMYGAVIDWEIREAIEDNLDELTEKWYELHPERTEKKTRRKAKKRTKRNAK